MTGEIQTSVHLLAAAEWQGLVHSAQSPPSTDQQGVGPGYEKNREVKIEFSGVGFTENLKKFSSYLRVNQPIRVWMMWGFPGYPSDHCKIWSTRLTSFLKTITFHRISDPPCCTIFEISAPRRLSVSPPSQKLVSSLPPHRIYSHCLLPNETKSFNEVAYGNRSSRTTALTCHCKTTKKYDSRFILSALPRLSVY